MTKKKTELVAKFPAAADPEAADAMAKLVLNPAANAAVVIGEYAKPFGEQDNRALMEKLSAAIRPLKANNLSGCEAMLLAQAHALQAIFVSLSQRAIGQDHIANLEIYLRMALKAQNQCRQTLETLATIKNPPMVIARQANFANGPQQVNNGMSPHREGSHAANSASGQNELLEAKNGEWLDTRAAGPASSADPKLEAVGAVHRADQRRRQGAIGRQR